MYVIISTMNNMYTFFFSYLTGFALLSSRFDTPFSGFFFFFLFVCPLTFSFFHSFSLCASGCLVAKAHHGLLPWTSPPLHLLLTLLGQRRTGRQSRRHAQLAGTP